MAKGSSGEQIPEGYSKGQVQNFTPEAMQLYKQLFSHLGPDSYLSKLAGGDEELFRQIEAPALKQFGGIQGNIASRFSGMGTGGRKSSGFMNTQNQAAQDFAGQLQSQRQGLMSQALKDLMGMSNQLLGQKPYDNFLVKEENPWADIAGKVAGSIPGAVASYASGGAV